MRRTRRSTFLLPLLAGAPLVGAPLVGSPLIGCRGETRLLMTIEGDFAVPEEVDGLLVELRARAATYQTAHALTEASPSLLERLAVTEGRLIQGEVEVVVQGQQGNARIAEGRARARYQPELTVPVRVRLEAVPERVEDGGVLNAGGSP